MRLVLLLLAGCATPQLQRTPKPQDAAPIAVVMTSSSCPGYRVELHEDGLVEYWGDHMARVFGVGWLRVDPGVVERLRWLPVQRKWKIRDIENERWCTVADAPGIGFAVRGPEGWTGLCTVPPLFDREEEILKMLGVASLLLPRPGPDVVCGGIASAASR